MLSLLGIAAAGVAATACGQGGDGGGALRMLTYDDATESALLRTQLDELVPQRYSGFVEGLMISAASPRKDEAAHLLDFLARADV